MATLFFTLFTILCIYPFYYIFIYSLSNPVEVTKKTMTLLPVAFTLDNYLNIFKLKGILGAFVVSSTRTVIGTGITVIFSSMLAYALTKALLPYRKVMYKLVVMSMYINAGLIPWYIIMLKLGMKNNYLAYILPSAVNAYLLILVKTYIEQIPAAIEESALMDGAGFFTIFRKIVFPLCKPITAAIAVFSAVDQWNKWYDNLFLMNNKNMMTLQLTLLNFLREAEALAQAAMSGSNVSDFKHAALSPMSIKMTITMLVTIPIILVYPIFQKYFVKGIMLGSVKG